MILHILANTFERRNDLDTVLGQLFRIANAGQHQKLRRIDRTTRDHNLFARFDNLIFTRAVFVADARRALPFKKDIMRLGMCDDGQVFARFCRTQKRGSGRAPQTIFSCQLKETNAFLVGPVVIWIELVACCLRGFDPSVCDWALDAHVGDRKFALITMKRICTTLIRF